MIEPGKLFFLSCSTVPAAHSPEKVERIYTKANIVMVARGGWRRGVDVLQVRSKTVNLVFTAGSDFTCGASIPCGLQPDSLYLTQCNFVLRPIVKFGCPRRFMPGHLLGVLEASVVFQINRDAGRPPGVTSDWGLKTHRLGSFPNRSPSVVSVKSLVRSQLFQAN